jgi:hypothetical protein
MASIIRTDALQNLNTSNIITQTNATTITVGASGQTITIPAGATLTNSGTASGFGLTWQSVQTTSFTAVKGNAYPCNTTSAAFTVTLPATPSAGDQIQLVDYAGTFDTNGLVVNPNGNKLEGATSSLQLSGEREGVILTYIDSTQGWIATSGINEGTDAFSPLSYSADFLVIAGGGGGGADTIGNQGGGGAGGYRNSYSTEQSGGGGSSEASLTFTGGTVYTITVGAGGAADVNGNDSSISGTGITTITSNGGGRGGKYQNIAGASGGSGGGGGQQSGAGGAGTANQGYAGGSGFSLNGAACGGGGAGAVGGQVPSSDYLTGGNGGAGLASSITGSSVTRGGGGGGSNHGGVTIQGGFGGAGGGGNGRYLTTSATAGTANTGGGAGAKSEGVGTEPSGGSGVVILRIPTAFYSGTTTGSPTVSTSGSDTILVYNASGSYTG